MDSESIVSEPISAQHRAYAKQKSASMTLINPKTSSSLNKHNMLSDSVSQQSTNQINNIGLSSTTSRRRKGGGSLSAMRVSRNGGDTKELRTAVQDREAVIQNLRIQLCLGKLPRPTGPPLNDNEKPVAEKKLEHLKTEAENRKIKIKNIKRMLEKLDVTDNIDIRIRQAELEYALGREELQLLSIVEETRALQARLEKSKPESQTLFNILNTGATLSLHAVTATSGRWSAQPKPDHCAFYIEWALEGDGLYKGDRILEINGNLITCKTKEELQQIVGNTGKCQMVVLRRKAIPIPLKELDQEKENNLRLQHRISYLEEQVQELQAIKERSIQQKNERKLKNHITSININSPDSEEPVIFQRGNYITTLVGGKPIELTGDSSELNPGRSSLTTHITKTVIKENNMNDLNESANYYTPRKSLSSSKVNIGSPHLSMSKKDTREREIERQRSVEQLNNFNVRRESSRSKAAQVLRDKSLCDIRSVKSLNMESDKHLRSTHSKNLEVNTLRPTPPKKPQRLSLQRAQSLQTVELNPNGIDSDRKRALKRAHITQNNKSLLGGSVSGSTNNLLIDKGAVLHTSSLGRQKQYV